MKELLIRHEVDGKIVNRFRIKPKSDLFTVGSSRKCNIRMLGEGIEPLHMCFESRGGKWYAIDLATETGTWVDNNPIVELEIIHDLNLKIGQHNLSVDLVEVSSFEVFQNQKKIDIQGEQLEVYQQIAVFFRGELTESFLRPPKEVVEIPYNAKKVNIPLPESDQWKEHVLGDLVVKNRLVRSSKFVSKEKTIWTIFPQELALPLAASFGATLLFFLMLYVVPKALSPDPGGLKENQYTKLMFDQKTIEKQKKKAQKIAKNLEKKPKRTKISKKPKAAPKQAKLQVKQALKQGKKPAPSRSNTKVDAKVRKIASKIKSAGLSSMVSKISERASSNARLIKSAGIKASQKGGGRAFASVGDVKKGSKIGSAATVGSFRVGGVSTKGEAGGSSVSSSLAGLSGRGIGTASVGAIDEETEVEGGLTAEQIARVVKKNIGAVRYCYERQLAANPNLYGKIKVEFVIAPTGRVMTQKIKSTTMNSKLVEGCILRKIKRWVFPLPKGGSEVAVSYPFYFKATR